MSTPQNPSSESVENPLDSLQEDATGLSQAAMLLEIAEAELTRKALRQSEEKYRRLHESMMDAFISVDMSGRIIECNRAYQEMLGYSMNELRCLTYLEITPAKWHAMESRLVAEQILPLGFSELYEKEYRRKDGTILPVELRTFLIRDDGGRAVAMWAIVRDITERKQTEQSMREWNELLVQRVDERTHELAQSEERFRQLTEVTFEALAISKDGILLDCNTQFTRIHGYELAEVIGRTVADFVAPESRALVVANMASGKETNYEYMGLRKNGSVFPAEAHGRMGQWMGHSMRISAIRDLTQSKHTEARLQALQVELEQVQRLALISEVSAGIIHQIAQPLSAMAVNVSSVKSRLKACKSRTCGSLDIMEDVDADIERMREIVIHMRRLLGTEPVPHPEIHLNEIVEGVLPLLRDKAMRRKSSVLLELGQGLPPVCANAVQLSQVILNLLQNALDACADCPPERRVLVLSTRALAGVEVELSLRDMGTGISPEVMPRLFNEFASTKPEGFGVGLRISHSIVEAHGGRIRGYNNTDGPGATFEIILPGTLPNLKHSLFPQ